MPMAEMKFTMIAVDTPCRDIAFAARTVVKSIHHGLAKARSAAIRETAMFVAGTALDSPGMAAARAGRPCPNELLGCSVSLLDYERASLSAFIRKDKELRMLLSVRGRGEIIDSVQAAPPTSGESFLFLLGDDEFGDIVNLAAKAMACMGPTYSVVQTDADRTANATKPWLPILNGRISTMADLIRDPDIRFEPRPVDFATWRQAAETWGNWQRPFIGLEPDLVDELLTMNSEEIQERLRAVVNVDTVSTPSFSA